MCEKNGIETGVDVLALMDVAEEVTRPLMPRPAGRRPGRRCCSATPGVYGSFLLHAQRAAERYGVSQAEILLELGRRKVVGGQEDMIIDVALELAREHADAEVAVLMSADVAPFVDRLLDAVRDRARPSRR